MSDLQGGAVRPRRPLPSGTVTFLFTDIEGSTQLLRRLGEEFGRVLSEHRALLRDAFDSHGGVEVHAEGDSSLTVFTRAGDAVAAALDGQRAIAARAWPPGGEVRVRMGIHTGEAVVVADDYVGLAVHQAARICAAGHGGQVLVSETSGELASAGLPTGAILMPLGEYRLKDVEAPERLHQLVHPDLDPSFPPLRVLEVLPNNLPTALSSFVGREEALEEVRRLLGATRLVTIRGPGGAGKTRLALEAARGLLERFVDGVWLVDLASLTEDGLIPQRVASVLGVREEPSRELTETLTDRLRGSDLLLVLDNCEHVLDACARFLTDLMRACPGVRVLATSREPLGVPGETTWLVTPMDVPEADGLDPYALLGFDAVRLFVERACTVQPGFVMTPSEADHVAQVCRRLDGIPLAIELAAARVKVLTPAALLERLDRRLPLLTAATRDAPERQRTLRATIEWSHELLAPEEQALFARLAVFRGGWTLESAEAVVGADIDTLESLVDKSLVRVRPESGRFWMLETIREFATERLDASEEAAALRDRHADHFRELAERTYPQLGPDPRAAVRLLEAEHDNLRAALDHLAAIGSGADSVQLAGALWKFWLMRAHVSEGLARLDRALAMDTSRNRHRVRGLIGTIAMLAGTQPDRARALSSEALEIARALDDPTWVANTLFMLGWTENESARYASAIPFLEEALEIFERLGDDHYAMLCRFHLGWALSELEEPGRAWELDQQNLAAARATGNVRIEALALESMAWHHRVRFAELEEALESDRGALRIWREVGETWKVPDSLTRVAVTLAMMGRADDAARLHGRSSAMWEELGLSRPGHVVHRDAEIERLVTEQLGTGGMEARVAEGRGMTNEEAVRLALGE